MMMRKAISADAMTTTTIELDATDSASVMSSDSSWAMTDKANRSDIIKNEKIRLITITLSKRLWFL